MTSLKAFVQYDRSGRIIPSSVILARSKPKNGKWQEIVSEMCCTSTTTSTTLTLTSTTTTTTTSLVHISYSISSECECVSTAGSLTPDISEGCLWIHIDELPISGELICINGEHINISVAGEVRGEEVCSDFLAQVNIYLDGALIASKSGENVVLGTGTFAYEGELIEIIINCIPK